MKPRNFSLLVVINFHPAVSNNGSTSLLTSVLKTPSNWNFSLGLYQECCRSPVTWQRRQDPTYLSLSSPVSPCPALHRGCFYCSAVPLGTHPQGEVQGLSPLTFYCLAQHLMHLSCSINISEQTSTWMQRWWMSRKSVSVHWPCTWGSFMHHSRVCRLRPHNTLPN